MASTQSTGRSRDFALLALRLVFGGMMLTHGIPKLMGFAENSDSFPDPLGVGSPVAMALAIFAEVVCAGLVVVGAFTRLAVIPLMTTMIVAAFIVHAADPLAKKELALLYLTAYAALGLMGAGRFSIDAKLPARFAKLK
ncbi:MAG: DoxX family protein [Sandaracinus sp.]|nr:DoxX family protein [Sandaracinus sp.]|tara:strand:- start:596 stop:1012 length:417 start_codon:yes stop_codon:yes gene_type:complete